MNRIVHPVILKSHEHFDGKLPPRAVGYFLAELPGLVRAAVSMALRCRSQQAGRRPAWLDRAADIRYDVRNASRSGDGETTLYFEAPPLGEAAEELYRQGELWPTRPAAADTGFDLLGDVLADVDARNADSDRFDPGLLKRLGRFQKAFSGPYDEVQIESRRYAAQDRARLSRPIIQTAARLLDETPLPRRVRVVGVLDMIRASNQTLALLMQDGSEVRGTLLAGEFEALAKLLRGRVLIFGTVCFRPSGRLLRVDADEFRPATDADQFFAKVPKPFGRPRRKYSRLDADKMAQGLKSILGKWPGDETDEQIEAALKELS
jgi:hypothetical protein